jgi:hypothetical protein
MDDAGGRALAVAKDWQVKLFGEISAALSDQLFLDAP